MTTPPFITGPWAVEGLLIAKPHYQSDPIAWVARSFGDKDEVIKANANLIAAAPELYAALRECADAIGDWARPTSANGATSADADHPLCNAARHARAALNRALQGE